MTPITISMVHLPIRSLTSASMLLSDHVGGPSVPLCCTLSGSPLRYFPCSAGQVGVIDRGRNQPACWLLSLGVLGLGEASPSIRRTSRVVVIRWDPDPKTPRS